MVHRLKPQKNLQANRPKVEEAEKKANTTPATGGNDADTTTTDGGDAASYDASAETATGNDNTAAPAGETQAPQGQVLGVVRARNTAASNDNRKSGKVLGANRDRVSETGDAEEIEEAGEPEIVEAENDETKKIVKIADEEVALAKAPEQTGFRFSWWWLLLILLLLVIIKVIYDKYKERNEAIAKANIAKIEEENRNR